MKKSRILLILLALILVFPFKSVLGFDVSDDEEERDLVKALVFMAAHNDAASGGLSADELYAIRDHVGAYYDRNILYAKQAGASDLQAFWEGEKKADLAEIKKASYAAWVEENGNWLHFLANFFRSLTNPDAPKFPDPKLANTVANGAARASQMVNDQDIQQNQSLLAASSASKQGDSYANIVTGAYISNDLARLPDSAPILQAAYSNLSLSPFTSSLSNPADQESTQAAASDSRSSSPELKPLRFQNNGSRAVTVMVESYIGQGAASSASTVVFPESSSAAVLELPGGEYRFCYEWETGGDEDGDGYADLRHALTGSYTLTENSTSNPQSAALVSLDPDSVSSRSGKCGQEIAEVYHFEQAFNGEHRYWASVVENGCSAYEYETYPKYTFKTLSFNSDFTQVEYGGRTYNLTAPHNFHTIRDDGRHLLLTFTESGYALGSFLTEADYNTGNSCVTFTFVLEDQDN